MSNRLEHAAAVAQKTEMPWNSAHIEQSLSRLVKRQRRRRVVQSAVTVAVLLVVSVFAFQFLPNDQTPPSARLLRFQDGSTATLLGDAVANLQTETLKYVEVEVSKGRLVFDVIHSRDRIFVVRAGQVAIFDLGTVFSVEREGERVHVAVTEGKVRVEAPAEATELQAGESRWFSEISETPRPVEADAVRQETRPSRRDVQGARLEKKTPADEIEALLLRADALRRQHRLEEAVKRLQEIVERHSGNRRAPLAAFTLGKLHVELGKTLEAAEAFETAQGLDPDGPLVEDAMGREMDARLEAGDVVRARALAQEYL